MKLNVRACEEPVNCVCYQDLSGANAHAYTEGLDCQESNLFTVHPLEKKTKQKHSSTYLLNKKNSSLVLSVCVCARGSHFCL